MVFNHRANLLAFDNSFFALKVFMKNDPSLYSSIFLIFFIIIANEKIITIRKVIDALSNCFPRAKYSYMATINRINTKTLNANILHSGFFLLCNLECILFLEIRYVDFFSFWFVIWSFHRYYPDKRRVGRKHNKSALIYVIGFYEEILVFFLWLMF